MQEAYDVGIFKGLTDTAHGILLSHLEGHSNTVSNHHSAALRELCSTMTQFVSKDMRGRVAFPLATGLGKTSAVLAWIVALHRLGMVEAATVAVAASQVRSLCKLKADLMAYGVPEDLIGLRHSYAVGEKDGVTLPNTGDNDRPIMRVTHSRVRGSKERELFTMYEGAPRDLMVYDETLFRADAFALRESLLRAQQGWLEGLTSGSTRGEYADLLAHLRASLETVKAALQGVRDGNASGVLELPALGPDKLGEYVALLEKHRDNTELLGDFLKLTQERIRAVPLAGNDGVIHYVVAVPDELRNVLVLDASHPIRELVHGGGVLERGAYAKGVKSFDNVTIYQLPYSGSRESLTEAFKSTLAHQRLISREVIDIIKSVPPEESTLVFAFKGRGRKQPNMGELLLADIRAEGIDPEAKTAEGKRRVEVATWGNETGLNDYGHCRNVILMGVLHRSLIDVAAAYAGEKGDLLTPLTHEDLYRLLHSEIAHCVYQALSRGSCRRVDNGQAAPMKAWVIHKRKDLRDTLEKVLPGAKWEKWKPAHLSLSSGKIAETAAKIAAYLQGLPEGIAKVSNRSVKAVLRMEDIASSTFANATKAVEAQGWKREGYSFVRAGKYYFGGA